MRRILPIAVAGLVVLVVLEAGAIWWFVAQEREFHLAYELLQDRVLEYYEQAAECARRVI